MAEPLIEEQQRDIDIALRDFDRSAENYIKLLGLVKEEERKFLQIKLGFVGILGVIFSIILSPENDFGKNFIITFAIVLIISVLLLIIDLWKTQIEAVIGVKKQVKINILKKIRLIATLDKDLRDYGIRAQELLINDDKFRNSMKNKEPITSIIDIKIGKWFYISLILWSLIFISIPVLFFIRFL